MQLHTCMHAELSILSLFCIACEYKQTAVSQTHTYSSRRKPVKPMHMIHFASENGISPKPAEISSCQTITEMLLTTTKNERRRRGLTRLFRSRRRRRWRSWKLGGKL